MDDRVRKYTLTMGLPVTITFDSDGFLRVTVDVGDVGELTRDVADGSANLQALDHGQDIWRDASMDEAEQVAEYLSEHLSTPWVDMDDAPGWGNE